MLIGGITSAGFHHVPALLFNTYYTVGTVLSALQRLIRYFS